MEDMLRVGVISSTHGVRGEVKVFPTTDDAKRFKKLKTVILDIMPEPVLLHIESVKFFKNMVILKFEEFNNINEVEDFGILKDVMKTGANDVYVIEGKDGKEYLFPAIKQCVLNVDLEAQTIMVHIMDGLLEL